MAYYDTIRVIKFSDGTKIAEDITPAPKVTGEEETWVVGQGDTLLSICFAKYQNHKDWDIIAKFNNIEDPFNLPIGKTLLIPKQR
jgi:nucleoid-associated protein YgaU